MCVCVCVCIRTDVSTDVVGKYCYYLDMPLEKRRVPLLVDVTLMGRNKIMKLHSALFVEVSALQLRLYLVGAFQLQQGYVAISIATTHTSFQFCSGHVFAKQRQRTHACTYACA